MSDDDLQDGEPRDDVPEDDEGSESSVWDEIEAVTSDEPDGSDSADHRVEPDAGSSDDRIADPNVDATTDPTIIDEQSPEPDPEPDVTDATVIDDQVSDSASEAADPTVVDDQPPGSDLGPDATTDATVVDDQFPDAEDDSTADAVVGESDGTAADEQLLDADAEAETDDEEMFEQRDVSAIDGESLWDELATTGTEGTFGDEAAESTGVSAEDEPADAVGSEDRETESVDRDSPAGEEALIDKRAYCQQCPYFTEPPEVRCTNDGTTIVEVLEDGRFRVTSCPVVTETGPDRTILNDGH